MKRSEELLDRSIAATLSAIEIYNKPDFKYREEVFAILIINGWELLLKAKLLADGGEDIRAITAMDKGVPKKSRTGADLTIGIESAIGKLNLDARVRENIEFVLELRDAAIHFVNDTDVKYMAYALGAASLQNYQRLCRDWFSRSLDEYNFYILPLGFSYNFKTLDLLDASSKPAEIAALLEAVDDARDRLPTAPEDTFHLVCEVRTQLVAAKQVADTNGATLTVSPDAAKASVIAVKLQRLIDRYPLTYQELTTKVKERKPDARLADIQSVIKANKMKSEQRYSAPHFRNKREEQKYKKTGVLPKGMSFIYNEDAVKFIVKTLP